MLARKARVVPFECVARGFLAGSGYREYVRDRQRLRHPAPRRAPAGEPAPGADLHPGHQGRGGARRERRLRARSSAPSGPALAATLRDLTLALYAAGAAHAAERDLILADTKFEFGHAVDSGELLLIDEVLTPDSSRYWDLAHWLPGEEPASFDKQFVRNWLDASGWDRESPPPELPADVVAGTLDRYVEAFRRLTGREPEL